MDRTRQGLIAGLAAYLLWGAMPVYFLLMRPAGPFEIVAWRVLLSLVLCALLVALVPGGRRRLRTVLASRRTVGLLALAGALIWVNWTVYVFATTSGRVVDAALGYFVNPIVTILLGVLVEHERLRPAQWVAVGVSAVAVIALAVEAAALPWIALALAASFGCYGLVKKRVGRVADVVSGLALETAWLAPVAVVQLAVVSATGALVFGTRPFPTAMLATAGIVTAAPLLLFAAAARRLPLSVAGFLQYVTPILQFLVGVLVLHEPMPPARLAGFCLVWVALAVLIGDSAAALTRSRRSARPAGAMPAA